MIVFQAWNAPRLIAIFLIATTVMLPLTLYWARSTRRPVGVTTVFTFAVAAAVTVTIPSDFPPGHTIPSPEFSLLRYLGDYASVANAKAAAAAPAAWTPENVFNVALFFPVGMLGHLVIRRWWVAAAAAASLSFTLELLQDVSGLRDGSAVDFWRNVAGALIGIAAAAVLTWSVRRFRSGGAVPPSREPAAPAGREAP